VGYLCLVALQFSTTPAQRCTMILHRANDDFASLLNTLQFAKNPVQPKQPAKLPETKTVGIVTQWKNHCPTRRFDH
jgi:hypothetical protein